MLDKILAALSIATLVAFMAIVVLWVNELDLWIVTSIVLVMAVFDFVQTTRKADKNARDQESSS